MTEPVRVARTVSDAHANSVSGPSVGGRQATTTAWAWADLSAYEGRYVEIRAESEALYICFVAADEVEPDASVTANFVTDGCPILLSEGELTQRVVPESKPFLAFKCGGTANGVITIHGTEV